MDLRHSFNQVKQEKSSFCVINFERLRAQSFSAPAQHKLYACRTGNPSTTDFKRPLDN